MKWLIMSSGPSALLKIISYSSGKVLKTFHSFWTFYNKGVLMEIFRYQNLWISLSKNEIPTKLTNFIHLFTADFTSTGTFYLLEFDFILYQCLLYTKCYFSHRFDLSILSMNKLYAATQEIYWKIVYGPTLKAVFSQHKF